MDGADGVKSSNKPSGSGNSNDLDNDGEDAEESSLQNNNGENVEEMLASFREKWQKELRISPENRNKIGTGNSSLQNDVSDVNNDEEMARILFLKGVEMERTGKLYEAIQFYRRAVQIVPDIEFRLDNKNKARQNNNNDDLVINEEVVHEEHEETSDSDEDEEIKDGELYGRIQRKLARMQTLCVPKIEQKTTHISVLPVEIILLILRWLVSVDLDLRSLEMFSKVCRGFYICARDQEIWRLVCLRVWGLNCGPTPGIYTDWRQMFIERARVHFHGCYISKTSYIRHGEASFQDQFYRPWHLVTYYRYLRFFPEGLVLMLTSADEPGQCVGFLKRRDSRQPVMSGYYRLKDDRITLVVQRQDLNKDKGPMVRKGKKKQIDEYESVEQTFHMELQIKNANKKRHAQLSWTHYSIYSRNRKGDESTCDFDLVTNRFPPLWFSRVKSYTAESDAPL